MVCSVLNLRKDVTMDFLGDRIPALKTAMNIATPIKVGPTREPLVNIWEDKVKKMQLALHNIMPNNVPAP